MEETRELISPTTVRQAQACNYCGGSLDLRYHFCIHCAEVYRDPAREVYEEPPPAYRSLETKVTEEAGPAWNFFCLLASGLVVFGFLGQILGEERFGLTLLLSEIFLIATTGFYLVKHWKETSYLFTGLRLSWVLFACVPILATLLAINKGYHDLLLSLLELEQGDPLGGFKDALGPVGLVVSICVLPGIVEEIGFRGVVQERMVTVLGTVVGYSMTSILFVALHFSLLSAPYLFLLSMFLCWVRTHTRSLYPVIVLHFLHNFVVLVVFYGAFEP